MRFHNWRNGFEYIDWLARSWFGSDVCATHASGVLLSTAVSLLNFCSIGPDDVLCWFLSMCEQFLILYVFGWIRRGKWNLNKKDCWVEQMRDIVQIFWENGSLVSICFLHMGQTKIDYSMHCNRILCTDSIWFDLAFESFSLSFGTEHIIFFLSLFSLRL